MHAAAISPREGVSPRSARLRGQSIIEYVLIIALIGLVIVFAGPGVAGAIRNQFNQVTNTVNSGTTGGGTEGGSTGGGSTGADSATVQAAVAKDAKDWTLDEQKAVAEDIAAKGEASPAYAKAEAAMDAGTKWSVKLTDGKTLEYRIIGINHDDLADGSGKAGLTFEATNGAIGCHQMNTLNTNAGGWEQSELRQKMNSGEIWKLMPSDLQSKVKAVTKLTNNVGGNDKNAAVTTTSDKLFLLSYSEIVPDSYWASSNPWTSTEGTQYEVFKDKVTSNYSWNDYLTGSYSWWERSVYPYNSTRFLLVNSSGYPSRDHSATSRFSILPAFCF